MNRVDIEKVRMITDKRLHCLFDLVDMSVVLEASLRKSSGLAEAVQQYAIDERYCLMITYWNRDQISPRELPLSQSEKISVDFDITAIRTDDLQDILWSEVASQAERFGTSDYYHILIVIDGEVKEIVSEVETVVKVLDVRLEA